MQTRIFLVFSCLFAMATLAYGTAALQSGIIIGDGVNLRAEPGLDSRIITVLRKGLPVSIVAESDRWYQAQLPDGQTGWIYRQYVELKPLATVVSGEHFTTFPVDQMIVYAKGLTGIRYVYGGQSSQGFDCSGFTRYVFAKFGINLPRQADLQIGVGVEVASREELALGDLVFFKTESSTKINHVGIYVGDRQFIHASSGSGVVRISPLDSGYYYKCFVGGRRLIENNVRDTSMK